MNDTIELVRFRLQEGKTAQDWLKLNETINEWMQRQPGFRFRSVSETGDGEWWDLVYWENLAAAETAGEKFSAEMLPACLPLVEQGSVVITRSTAHMMQQG